MSRFLSKVSRGFSYVLGLSLVRLEIRSNRKALPHETSASGTASCQKQVCQSASTVHGLEICTNFVSPMFMAHRRYWRNSWMQGD